MSVLVRLLALLSRELHPMASGKAYDEQTGEEWLFLAPERWKLE